MKKYFPFETNYVGEDEQLYQLFADFDSLHLAPYKLLFDKYGNANCPVSLVDVTALVLEEVAPELLDCMDFDEEGCFLDMHVDSEASLQAFSAKVCPVFQNLALLESYIKRTANR